MTEVHDDFIREANRILSEVKIITESRLAEELQKQWRDGHKYGYRKGENTESRFPRTN